MLKRYLSTSVKRISCGDCVFYNNKNGLCKFNKLPALDNRKDDSTCGKEAKNFWKIDRNNKYKGNVSCLLTMGSGFTFMWGLFIQGNLTIATISGISTIVSYIMTDIYYNKYDRDNYIFKEKNVEKKKMLKRKNRITKK